MRILLLLALAACDLYVAPAPEVETDAAPPPSAYETEMDAVKVACDDAFRCRDSCPDPGQFETEYGTSEAACVTMLENDVRTEAQELQASVDAGRILYRPDAAEECLAWYSGLACADYWNGASPQPPSCNTAFQGTVPTGGACTIPMDCAVTAGQCAGSPMVCTP